MTSPNAGANARSRFDLCVVWAIILGSPLMVLFPTVRSFSPWVPTIKSVFVLLILCRAVERQGSIGANNDHHAARALMHSLWLPLYGALVPLSVLSILELWMSNGYEPTSVRCLVLSVLMALWLANEAGAAIEWTRSAKGWDLVRGVVIAATIAYCVGWVIVLLFRL